MKNPAYSLLDLAPVRVGQTIADAFKGSRELAQSAEKFGYKRYWLAEHHNMAGIASAATSVLIGHIAGATSTIRVGSGGIMLPNHAPLVIAEQFGTLETLYPGRIDLGLGRAPGTDQATARALRRNLGGHGGHDFPEQLEELLRYFSASSEDRVHAYPGRGLSIPIWLLGSSDFSARLAAELGFPFAFASHFAPEELLAAINIYRRRFKPSRALAEPYVMVGVPLVAAETDSRARFLATTPLQRGLSHVRGETMLLKPPIDEEVMNSLWSYNERRAVESRMGVAVVGGHDTIREKLTKLARLTEADEFMLVSDLYDQADRVRSFEIAAEVLSSGVNRELLKQ